MNKIIILIIGCEKDKTFEKLESTVRSTWVSDEVENISTFFIYGNKNNSETVLIDDKIYCNHPDMKRNIGYKTLDSFKFIDDNYEYDYIFRTNLSSYIDKKLLYKYVEDKPYDNFYDGMTGIDEKSGVTFASGSGYFISKDLVKIALEDKQEWNHGLWDDVALGKIMMARNINIYGTAKRGSWDERDSDGNIPNEHYHYRCRQKDRNDDTLTMYEIHKNKSVK